MDFSAWSPSHTILVLFGIAAFIGNVAIMFYRIGQLEKRTDKIEEQIEKGFAAIQSEIRDMRLEMSKMNQNFIDHLNLYHGER